MKLFTDVKIKDELFKWGKDTFIRLNTITDEDGDEWNAVEVNGRFLTYFDNNDEVEEC